MAVSQRLELRQGQSLVMTPQLQQAIKLLQLSNLELAEYVEAELEKNPLLEREDADRPTREEPVAEAAEPQRDDAPIDEALKREDFGTASDMDAGHDDMYADETRADRSANEPAEMPAAPLTDWSRVGAGGQLDGDEDLEGALSTALTLKDHLEGQLAIAALSADRRFIAMVLIEAVDEAGYVRADLAEIAERLGATRDDCEATLKVLQGFDPPGVCARDLAECLAIQLKERDRLDPAMQVLLTRLDLVAKRDFAALAALCELDTADIGDMLCEIRALNPKPGLTFGSEPVQPVVPDVYVREGPDGAWHVELNSDTLPRVLVNSRYYTKVSRGARSRDDKAYITECLNSANWLVKSLDQRARTILKVASEISRQQDAFLTHGVRHLRPLNLRVIADAISMHESTVSRVTSNKYIATPRGLFEMKYFFTAAIQSADGGEAHSAEAVRDRIKELISNENGEILSDDRIVTLLSADGVSIARRTVAKYREAMHIPSSVARRRLRYGDEAPEGRSVASEPAR
jgi:RNA polymerase sigma-54 factor